MVLIKCLCILLHFCFALNSIARSERKIGAYYHLPTFRTQKREQFSLNILSYITGTANNSDKTFIMVSVAFHYAYMGEYEYTGAYAFNLQPGET